MTCTNAALLEKHSHGRFVFYKLMTAIPVFAACLAFIRYAHEWYWLAIYIGICLTHATIIYLFKCPHCHYYRNGDPKSHQCFFIWGTPKIRKPSAEAAPAFLKIYVPIAMLVMIGYPIYWLSFQWELLVVFLLSITTLLYSILLQECSRCPSFGCPNNRAKAHLNPQN